MKLVVLVAVPAVVVTAMGPVVAPAGTMAVILTCVLMVMVVAVVPLNLTDEAPARLAPLMVTLAPIAPVDGVKLVIRGATTKLVALVAVPPGVVVTPIVPVVALAGTVAVICVGRFHVECGGGDAVEPNRRGAGEVGARDRDARARGPAGRRESGDPRRHGEGARAIGRAGRSRDVDRARRGIGGDDGDDPCRRVHREAGRSPVERHRRRAGEVGAIDGHVDPDRAARRREARDRRRRAHREAGRAGRRPAERGDADRAGRGSGRHARRDLRVRNDAESR